MRFFIFLFCMFFHDNMFWAVSLPDINRIIIHRLYTPYVYIRTKEIARTPPNSQWSPSRTRKHIASARVPSRSGRPAWAGAPAGRGRWRARDSPARLLRARFASVAHASRRSRTGSPTRSSAILNLVASRRFDHAAGPHPTTHRWRRRRRHSPDI